MFRENRLVGRRTLPKEANEMFSLFDNISPDSENIR